MSDNGRRDGGRAAGRADLRLISGGRTRRLHLNGRAITVAPADTPPFDLDARVFEEDTFRIMSAAPVWAPPETHPLRLMHELRRYEPNPPGSVVIQAGRPLRLLAIVHDVNCDPTWRPGWIETALGNVMQAAAQHRLDALGLPLLGRQHGRLPRSAFVDLLTRVLAGSAGIHPRRLWLIVSDPESVGIVFQALKDRLPS